jgi:hypothetical protein
MTRSWTRAFRAAALAAGVILPTGALAQVAPPGPISSGGNLAPLPGAGGRLFKLDVYGKVEYDSNVAGGEEAVAALRGLRKDDILYQPGVLINLNLPVGRQAVFLSGNVSYDFHQYNDTLNASRINLTGGGVAKVGPCSAALTAGYARNQTDQAILPLQVTENIQTVGSVGAQLRCGTGRLGEFVSVQDVSARNSADVGLIDSNEVSASAGLTYQNHALGQISLFGSYSSSDYGSSNDPTLPPTPGYRSYGGGISYARPIGRRLKGSLEFSYQSTRSRGVVGTPETTFTGFGTQGSLEYRVTPRLTATVLFSRDIEPTIQQGSNFTVVERAQLDTRYRVSSRISAGLGASWQDINYRQGALALPTFVDRDRIVGIYGNLGVRVGRQASLALDLRREVRNTNITIFNYTDYRVGVTATQSF